MEQNIIRLTKKHIKQSGKVLGRAFCNDPVPIQVIPNDAERKVKIEYIFQMITCLGIRYGEAHAISPNLEGIAIWIPFKTYEESFLRIFRCIFNTEVYKMRFEAQRRYKPIEKINKKLHLKYAPREHWYLQTLGIDPPHQGKGHGSELLKFMLERIDKQGLPVYLETSTEKNVKFYEKFGFKLMEELIIPTTRMKEYFMLRELH